MPRLKNDAHIVAKKNLTLEQVLRAYKRSSAFTKARGLPSFIHNGWAETKDRGKKGDIKAVEHAIEDVFRPTGMSNLDIA